MDRLAYGKLVEWKNSNNRKPLILNGARQVGKTWLLKEFGSEEYESVAYINCDEDEAIKGAFTDFDTERLVRVFSAISGGASHSLFFTSTGSASRMEKYRSSLESNSRSLVESIWAAASMTQRRKVRNITQSLLILIGEAQPTPG